MKLPAFFESSSSVAPTNSSGSPKRAMGVCERMLAVRWRVRIARFCSAGKKPGQIAFTRTPCGASSRATFWVRFTTAAFEAL